MRRKKLDPPTQWFVRIPLSLATAVEFRLCDPLTGRARYGARAALVESLLRDWLTKHPTSPLAPSPDAGDNTTPPPSTEHTPHDA